MPSARAPPRSLQPFLNFARQNPVQIKTVRSFFPRISVAAVLAFSTLPAFAVDIDGHIGAEEWQGAQHVTEFRKVQPLNGAPGSFATEAWILATAKGLAVAFHMTQPATVPRTRQRVQRDFQEQVDRVNVMLDFDGDGRTGYDFTVSS